MKSFEQQQLSERKQINMSSVIPEAATRFLDHMEGHPDFLAAGLCGSYRLGTSDPLSDLDVWVFVSQQLANQMTERFIKETFLPSDSDVEVLEEGRDDSIVPFVVTNVIVNGLVVNIKFLGFDALEMFDLSKVSLDNAWVDDFENFTTMQPLSDRTNQLAEHKARLLSEWASGPARQFANQLLVRYSSYYWRSAYQGVFRDELLPWHALSIDALSALCRLAYVVKGEVPPPTKWLLSDRTRRGSELQGRIDTAHEKLLTALTANDPTKRLDFYLALHELEEHVFRGVPLPSGFWWRRVFLDRASNVPELHSHIPVLQHYFGDQTVRSQAES